MTTITATTIDLFAAAAEAAKTTTAKTTTAKAATNKAATNKKAAWLTAEQAAAVLPLTAELPLNDPQFYVMRGADVIGGAYTVILPVWAPNGTYKGRIAAKMPSWVIADFLRRQALVLGDGKSVTYDADRLGLVATKLQLKSLAAALSEWAYSPARQVSYNTRGCKRAEALRTIEADGLQLFVVR